MISAGREDVDVRMLGRGRPVALELSDPKVATCSTDQLAEVTAATVGSRAAQGDPQYAGGDGFGRRWKGI